MLTSFHAQVLAFANSWAEGGTPKKEGIAGGKDAAYCAHLPGAAADCGLFRAQLFEKAENRLLRLRRRPGKEGFYAKVDLGKKTALVRSKREVPDEELKQVVRGLGYSPVAVEPA